MFDHVIVGVDGGPGGRDAIALGRALSSGRLTLVGAGDAAAVLEREARDAGLEADLVSLPKATPGPALLAVADERAADLVVLGAAHRGALGRAFLGDVGREVARAARCPVAVAPADATPEAPRRIAVGLNGSRAGARAIDLAAALAADRRAALTVLAVWEAPVISPEVVGVAAETAALENGARVSAERLLAETLERLPNTTAGEVLHGRPALALAQAVAGHDVLVIGHHDAGPLSRLVRGNTGSELVHHPPCPILLVPEAAAAPGDEHAERAVSPA